MKPLKSPSALRNTDHMAPGDAWRHVVIWILLALTALVLVGFTAVSEEIHQGRDFHSAPRSVSDSMSLPSELQAPLNEVLGILSHTSIRADKR